MTAPAPADFHDAGHRFDELVNLIEAWEARPPSSRGPVRWPLR